MVKGNSRQVIMVQSPDTKLFEQAIFILKDDAQDVTDDMLLREAKGIINNSQKTRHLRGPLWACCGAVVTGIAWLLTILL